MLKRLPALILGLGIFSLLGAPAQAALTPPSPAPIQAVTERLWGTPVVDRYRYFENESDPRTRAFFQEQATYTDHFLEGLGSARTALGRRIRALDRSSVSVSSVTRVGNAYFYERQNPSDETAKLYVRQAAGGPERVLVDPMAGHPAGPHHTLDWFVPSPNGRYVVYGISAGGSEESILHVLNVQTGKHSSEAIDRTRYGASGWLPDSSAFFYLRQPKVTAATPIVDQDRFLKTYLHRVGDAVSNDRAILGWKVDSQVDLGADDIAQIGGAAASKYIVAVVSHGVSNEVSLYVETAQELRAGRSRWRKIVDGSDEVTSFDIRGSTLYLLSHKHASNYRVLAVDLARPELEHPWEVVRQGRSVIQQIGVAQDGLYLRLLDGGIGRISRVSLTALHADALGDTLRLPYAGSVESITTDVRVSGVTFGLTGWTHSLQFYQSDARKRLADSGLKPLSPIDTRPYTSLEVQAVSKDGTHIPLSIIMKRGLVLDGSHPTYLTGYGAYGFTMDPYFSATRIAWLERGGIYAVAHIRGGGEFGEAWHHAAMRTTKERSIDDFIACAHYLIDHGYTSPAHLAGEGTSAGGIVIGGAITRAPHLFAAALDVVGVSDALRSEFSPNGPGNIPEFGTVRNQAEFRTLLHIDAYQNVHDGTAYPAVMLITGLNDPRVPPWELAKFAARLQAATSSGKPILLRVDANAGHGFLASSRTQTEALLTDEFSFLLAEVGAL